MALVPLLEEMLQRFDANNPTVFKRESTGQDVRTHEGVGAVNELIAYIKKLPIPQVEPS